MGTRSEVESSVPSVGLPGRRTVRTGLHGRTTTVRPHVSDRRTPRQDFRVLTRTRGGYGGATMHDVQLQVAATGSLVWVQRFSDAQQAEDFRAELDADLDALDPGAFRRKYSVPSTA